MCGGIVVQDTEFFTNARAIHIEKLQDPRVTSKHVSTEDLSQRREIPKMTPASAQCNPNMRVVLAEAASTEQQVLNNSD